MEAHWPLRLFFTGCRNDRVLFYRIAKQRGSSKNNSLGQQLLFSRPGITTILVGVRVYAGHMHSFRNARVDPHLEPPFFQTLRDEQQNGGVVFLLARRHGGSVHAATAPRTAGNRAQTLDVTPEKNTDSPSLAADWNVVVLVVL